MDGKKAPDPSSEIAVFVKTARKALGMTQSAISEMFDCTKGAVSGWENGRYEPPYVILRTLAERSHVPLPASAGPENRNSGTRDDSSVGVSPADTSRGQNVGIAKPFTRDAVPASTRSLTDDLEPDNFAVVKMPLKRIPLISWVQAGNMSDIVDVFAAGYADEWVGPIYVKPGSHVFALRVEGDSMTNSGNGINFPEGCTIFVDPDRAPKSGDYVVAKDVTTQKATFKKLTTDGVSWFLRPLNPAYPTREIDDPALRVIGVVIEWQLGGKL